VHVARAKLFYLCIAWDEVNSMTTTESTGSIHKSVLAHLEADVSHFAVAAAQTSFSPQGRTSHFSTFYSDGLLNHDPGDIIQLTSDPDWRTSWSIITPGNFSGEDFSDLLFYDPAAGVGEFYTTEGGNIQLLQTETGWRNSWTIIVPCNITGSATQDLLFYDPSSGTGEFYRTDGHGNISLIKTHTGWRGSWSLIIPCNLTGGGSNDLLFYDPSAGVGEMYRTDSQGNISLITTYTDWRGSWAQILACNLTGSAHTDLLFYDPGAGVGEMYRTDGQGGISLIRTYTDWRNSWSIIKACRISGGNTTDLMFYEPAGGVGEFYTTDGQGGINMLHTTDTWRHSWSVIAPANFTNGQGEDLIFYDRAAGTGEIYVTRGNTLSTAVLSTCEGDYNALRRYFNTTPDDLPFEIYVQSGSGGASHGSCDDSEIHCDAFSGDDDDLVRMLVVAETDECFMADQDSGWDCGQSNGEGLSRVLATHRYPNELGGFETGPSWLKSSRDNFINDNDGTDTNFVSTGCVTLFIHYLKFQLGYSFERITQAAGSNPSDTYQGLTGRTDAFAPFKALLDRQFAAGTSAPLSTDNPFPILRDLMFYEPSSGTGEFYQSGIDGGISLLRTDTGWRGSWAVITPGNFSGRSFNDLLFYDPGAGTGEFYTNDGQGQIQLLNSEGGWRSSWDMILPGRFGDGSFDGLLLYDRSAGTGEIYTTDGHGNISLLSSHTDWRTSWTTILVGHFTRNRYPDLLFYDASAGLIEVYNTDAQGNISLAASNPNLPLNWTLGISCNVTCGQFDNVMFYAPTAGQAQFFTSDGTGAIHPLSTQMIGTNWSQIHATAFCELLFYDASKGIGEYQRTDRTGNLTLLKRHTDWRQGWSIIAPGVYS
jgi:hypothetical protein